MCLLRGGIWSCLLTGFLALEKALLHGAEWVVWNQLHSFHRCSPQSSQHLTCCICIQQMFADCCLCQARSSALGIQRGIYTAALLGEPHLGESCYINKWNSPVVPILLRLCTKCHRRLREGAAWWGVGRESLTKEQGLRGCRGVWQVPEIEVGSSGERWTKTVYKDKLRCGETSRPASQKILRSDGAQDCFQTTTFSEITDRDLKHSIGSKA